MNITSLYKKKMLLFICYSQQNSKDIIQVPDTFAESINTQSALKQVYGVIITVRTTCLNIIKK